MFWKVVFSRCSLQRVGTHWFIMCIYMSNTNLPNLTVVVLERKSCLLTFLGSDWTEVHSFMLHNEFQVQPLKKCLSPSLCRSLTCIVVLYFIHASTGSNKSQQLRHLQSTFLYDFHSTLKGMKPFSLTPESFISVFHNIETHSFNFGLSTITKPLSLFIPLRSCCIT